MQGAPGVDAVQEFDRLARAFSTTSAPAEQRTDRAPTRPRETAAAGPNHFPCFDGLRALAASAVVIFHVAATTGLNARHPTLGAYTARLGGIGVAIFFVISGFLLYRPYALAHLSREAAPSTAPFYRRRFLRIFPAYWVAFTVYAFVLQLQSVHGVRQGVLYYGLFQVYDRHRVLTGLAQTWSLGTEVSFYLALPLLAVVAHRLAAGRKPTGRARPMQGELVLLGSLYLGAVAFRTLLLLVAPPSAGYAITWLPARLDWFALGIGLAVVSAWVATGGRPPRLLSAAAAYPALCWAFALELLWAMTQIGLGRDFEPSAAPQVMVGFALLGLLAFVVVLPAVLGRQDRGVIRGVLRSRPAARLGLISYGVFLWHALWIREIERLGRHHPAFAHLHFWSLLGMVSAATLVSAAVSYFVVEKPALRFKRSGSVKVLWEHARDRARRLTLH
jgi:peptidoglycan/LPS O-acetylase OafA/YrhL